MSDWIKCGDRLPTASGSYLVFKANSAYQYGTYGWLRAEGCWEPELMNKKRSESKPRTWVTHWQPLPAPPTE